MILGNLKRDPHGWQVKAVALRLTLMWLLATVTFGCDRKPIGPTAPEPGGPLPSSIEATLPAARSIGVFYETPIWVQFTAPLDTTTVNDHTVFFKGDTRRLPVRLRWEPATKRLYLLPVDPLALRKTYTVELRPGIRFETGGELGQAYSWQFSTISVRRPHSPRPFSGKVDESPFVALRWDGRTETSAGAVVYEVHAATDSAAAADPAGPGFAAQSTLLYLPRVRWRQDGPVYWAVHARNTVTGERMVSPVWRFQTLPADAPYDSVIAVTNDWDWVDVNSPSRQRCTEDSIAMLRNSITSAIRWSFGVPDSTVKLLGVGIEMTPRYAAHVAVAGPSVWSAVSFWTRCQQGWNGPPHTDEAKGKLADAVVLSPTRIRFASDVLTAHVEAQMRIGSSESGMHGYLFRSPFRRTYFGPGAGSETVRAILWLHVYRPAP